MSLGSRFKRNHSQFDGPSNRMRSGWEGNKLSYQ